MSHQQIFASLLAMLVASAAGCQTVRPDGVAVPLVADTVAKQETKSERPAILPWKSDEPKKRAPAQIVATWTDTVLQESGKGATRGFGGRLFFYGTSAPAPIAVEGQLVVYAFDETNRTPTDNKPTRRYVFPPQQFALHEGESELGVSYSFWLPWDKVGGKQTEVSLIARFEPLKGGTLIVSEQSAVRLPGQLDGPSVVAEAPIKSRITPAVAPNKSPVQAASHNVLAEVPAAKPRATQETTTIRLPSNHRLLRRSARRHDAAAVEVASAPAAGTPRTTVTLQPAGEEANSRLLARP